MSEDPIEQNTLCPICCDDTIRPSIRNCCKQPICKPCLHRHILCIFNEGVVGDGRTHAKCPLGCGRQLTDKEIRDSLRDSNFSFRHHVLGRMVYEALVMLFWVLSIWNGLIARWTTKHRYDGSTTGITTWKDVGFDCFVFLTISAAEMAELRQYERWNLTIALSSGRYNYGGRNESPEYPIYCPAPDCGYMWMASSSYRRLKIQNEPPSQSRNTRRNAFAASRLIAATREASAMLFYKPPKPEPVPPGWIDAEDIDLFCSVARHDRESNSTSDGRRLHCPNCRIQFCGLCHMPWTTLSQRTMRRLCHDRKSCTSFASTTASAASEDEYAFSKQAICARLCPGCKILTQRISGCNHMSCSCGMDWCYICEVRWNAGHYGCVERGDREKTKGCVVS